ncbi:hypothetical protein [Granulicella sibirica]|uniref:DUF2007 domain-containing protein n=1 Tax=Granulicella sibirica TaxID=2479048 RepID=A0A4Q0T9P2_9BACT|nr:hypothetical protein [Granulicella sibirica]RXH58828.1 hypothetical protein GRAN_2138 [Granulicella sibirica]
MDWTQEEDDRLTAYYRDLPEERLLHLAEQPEELTPIAQEILRREIALRGLDLAPDASKTAVEEDHDEESWLHDPQMLRDYAERAPEDCTFLFATISEANAARAFLLESKVESFLVTGQGGVMDSRGPRVVVKPADAEQASSILAQSIPEHIWKELEVEPEDFISPPCPMCGAPEPLLLAADPVNRWTCEECEHAWDEPAVPEEKA